jgi:hypothetical protein
MMGMICRRCLRHLTHHTVGEANHCARPQFYVVYRYDHHRFGPTIRNTRGHTIEMEDGKVTTTLYLANGGFVRQSDYVCTGERVHIEPTPPAFD